MTIRVLDMDDRGQRDYEKGTDLSSYDGTLNIFDVDGNTIAAYAAGTWSRAYVVDDED